MAAGPLPGKAPCRPLWKRNYGLFSRLFRALDALGQGRRQFGDGVNGFGGRAALGIEAVLESIDQRGADHRAVGVRAMARAFSGVRMPKPTQTGSLVWRLMRATAPLTAVASAAAAPVMPVIET